MRGVVGYIRFARRRAGRLFGSARARGGPGGSPARSGGRGRVHVVHSETTVLTDRASAEPARLRATPERLRPQRRRAVRRAGGGHRAATARADCSNQRADAGWLREDQDVLVIYNSAPRGRRAVAAPGAAGGRDRNADRTTTPGTTPSKAANTWVQLVTMRGHHVWLPRRYRLSAIMKLLCIIRAGAARRSRCAR